MLNASRMAVFARTVGRMVAIALEPNGFGLEGAISPGQGRGTCCLHDLPALSLVSNGDKVPFRVLYAIFACGSC
jgi:hypothetical protein